MSSIYIRPAMLSDATEIASVQRVSRISAFTGIIDQSYLDSLGLATSIQKKEQEWYEKLSSGSFHIFVAIDERENVVGYVKGGEMRDKVLPVDGEIHALYILPTHQKQGIGTRLFETMKKKFVSLGWHTFGIRSLTKNQNANGFYVSRGGIAYTTSEYAIGEKTYPLTGYIFQC